jgi:hypothetical protein
MPRKRRLPKYPFGRIEINNRDFMMWMLARSCEEVGRHMDRIALAAVNGDIAVVREYPFIERVVLGPSKRPPIPPSVRTEVLAVGLCAACGSTGNLVVDHIMPVVLGGSNERKNLQCLCAPCNMRKRDMHPDEWRKVCGEAALAEVVS